MGFMNPFLYANPDALNDVTTGINGGKAAGGKYGFPAVKGGMQQQDWARQTSKTSEPCLRKRNVVNACLVCMFQLPSMYITVVGARKIDDL